MKRKVKKNIDKVDSNQLLLHYCTMALGCGGFISYNHGHDKCLVIGHGDKNDFNEFFLYQELPNSLQIG